MIKKKVWEVYSETKSWESAKNTQTKRERKLGDKEMKMNEYSYGVWGRQGGGRGKEEKE